jgi:hypothetical protein
VVEHWHIKIADFGLSRHLHNTLKMTAVVMLSPLMAAVRA